MSESRLHHPEPTWTRAPRRRVASSAARSRGVALLLVVISLAVATVLALTFLASQSTTIGITRNLDRHARARQIAESGLALAMHEVRSNESWRDDHAHGTWVANQPYAGGMFTIIGHDGVDEDGDGVLSLAFGETDGDLADDPDDPATLTVVGEFDGVVHRVRATVWPAGDGGGGSVVPAASVFAATTISLSGSASIDSWDSTIGPYGGSNADDNAVIITNSTASAAVKASGSAVYRGDIFVGPGGDPANVFDGYGWGTGGVTGEVQPLPDDSPAEVEVPPHNILLPSSGNVSASGGSGWVYLPNSGAGGDLRINNLNGGGSKKIKVRGDLRLRVDGNVNIGGSSDLELDTDASLTMWVAGSVSFGAGIDVNGQTRDPARMIIYVTNGGDVKISGSSHVYATIIAPDSDGDISGSAELFGTFQGRSLDLSGSARLHQDRGLEGIPGLVTVGGGGGYTYTLRWVEGP